MNERIRELAQQATTIEEHGWGASYENFDREKFAELIIFECTKVAVFKNCDRVYTADVAGHVAAGRSIAARMIREHFEVKE
jgi:hypothetical protein